MTNAAKTLLLVEDEALIAMNEKMQLEKIGYSVDHVLTGEAAVTAALDSDSRPDLILMDIDLGKGIDGTQAAERILNEMEIPIVFVSSHTEPEVVEKTEKITSFGYVVKNSGLTVLDASIKMAFKLFESKMQEQRHKTDLLHSRDLMRYVIEHVRGPVAIHDREFKYIYVSKQYLDQFNVKERDVIGKHHYEVFPDLPQKFRDAHQRALRGEASTGENDPYQHSDGTTAWTRWNCRPWYEADGTIGGFIVYIEVLSQESTARIATRDALNYLRSILRTTRDGFAVVDMDGHFLEANDAACEMYGYRRDEFLQLSLWDLTMEYRPDLSAKRIEDVRRTGYALFEGRNRRKDGSTFDVEVSTSFLGGEEDRIVMFIRDISERKHVEERLHHVLHEYDTVFNGTQDGMFLIDVIDEDTYRLIRNNRAHAEASGLTMEQIANKTPQELLGKELGDEIAANYRRCYQAGHPISYEESFDLLEGKRTWFTTLTPIFDQGTSQHLVGASHDITERKEVERELQERETLLQKILDNSVDLIAIFGLDGTIQAVSKSHELLGYDLQSMIGRSATDFVHPDDVETMVEAIRDIARLEEESIDEYRLLRSDGEYVWVETHETVLRDANGNPEQLLVNARDISEQKQTIADLEQSKERFDLAIENTEAGVWDWDLGTGKVFFSPRWKSMLGYTDDEVENSFAAWKKLWHPDDTERIERILNDYRNGKTDRYEIIHRLRHKNGEWRWIQTRGDIVKDINGQPARWVGTNIDITERKRAEEALQAQLTEKETLFKEVHHRIKNNMVQIERLLSIQADSAESVEVKSALNTALSRIRGTRILYEKLLVGTGHEDVSMKDYLESLIESHVGVYNDNTGVSIETKIVDFSFSAKKAVPVGIILNELLTNVFKYAFGDRSEGHVRVELTKIDSQVTLTVQDNGVGFDERVAANTSTGFGLTLTKMLAEQLEGTFTIENDHGTKSVVSFSV